METRWTQSIHCGYLYCVVQKKTQWTDLEIVSILLMKIAFRYFSFAQSRNGFVTSTLACSAVRKSSDLDSDSFDDISLI